MLCCSVKSALLFERTTSKTTPRPSATGAFSTGYTLLKSVGLQPADSTWLFHSLLFMGGIPPSFPFRNSTQTQTERLCELCDLRGELFSLFKAILIETTRRTAAGVAFLHRRGYLYQVVRTICHLSRPAMTADAKNYAGLLAGAKGHRHTHASFSGGRSRPGSSPD